MKKKAHSIDMLFMLILFSVFAVMSVLLILIGSNVYGKIADNQEVNGNSRNILSYVTNKVRTCQVKDGVYIEEKDGTPVLVIVNSDDEYGYETLIFEKDGKLKEATILPGFEYNLEFGDILAKVSEFRFEIDRDTGILTLTVGCDGTEKSADIYVGAGH